MIENMARETGLEPAASAVTRRRLSNKNNDRFDSSTGKTGPKTGDSTPGVETAFTRGLVAQKRTRKPRGTNEEYRAKVEAEFNGGSDDDLKPPAGLTVGHDPLLAALQEGWR